MMVLNVHLFSLCLLKLLEQNLDNSKFQIVFYQRKIKIVSPDFHWQNTFATGGHNFFRENGRKSMTN